MTALWLAARGGHRSIAKYLVCKNAIAISEMKEDEASEKRIRQLIEEAKARTQSEREALGVTQLPRELVDQVVQYLPYDEELQ